VWLHYKNGGGAGKEEKKKGKQKGPRTPTLVAVNSEILNFKF
jgi:hypothetical protein